MMWIVILLLAIIACRLSPGIFGVLGLVVLILIAWLATLPPQQDDPTTTLLARRQPDRRARRSGCADHNSFRL
jgi:hypothetical protein